MMAEREGEPLFQSLSDLPRLIVAGDIVYRADHRTSDGRVSVASARVQAVRWSVVRLEERGPIEFGHLKDVPIDHRLGLTPAQALRGLLRDEREAIEGMERAIDRRRGIYAAIEAELAKAEAKGDGGGSDAT